MGERELVDEYWREDDPDGIPDGVEHFWDAVRTTDPEPAPGDVKLYALYDGPGTEPDPPAHEEILIGRYDADTDTMEIELRCTYSHLSTDIATATTTGLDYDLQTAQDDGYALKNVAPDDRLPLQKAIVGIED